MEVDLSSLALGKMTVSLGFLLLSRFLSPSPTVLCWDRAFLPPATEALYLPLSCDSTIFHSLFPILASSRLTTGIPDMCPGADTHALGPGAS